MKNPYRTQILSSLLIFVFGLLVSCQQSANKNMIHSQQISTSSLNDVQMLIDKTLPFVENLLNEYGEFFPMSSVIRMNDSISFVSTYDGNDRPPSEKVIMDLKKTINKEKEKYKVVAIFYDVKVIDPSTKLKTDAVAILVETKNDINAYTFYYPYQKGGDNKISFSKSWKIIIDKEILSN
jgi:hypothetical protein